MYSLVTLFMFLAVSAVAVADVLLKKTESIGSVGKALLSPWVIGAVVLYLFQIFILTHLFVSGAKLIHVGLIQLVLYSIIIVLAGIFIFGETLTVPHIVGIFLAISGIVLLNL